MKQPRDRDFGRRVGALVRRARGDLGLHQVELARRVGTGQSAISDVETGSTGVTVEMLRRVAEALDCRLKIVFERKSYETT